MGGIKYLLNYLSVIYLFLTALSRTLRLRRQEDSHEFLMFLFTAFQKSLLNGLG